MRKLLLLFIILTLFLTGCHGQVQMDNSLTGEEFDTPEEFDTTKNYEISFWAKNDTNNVQVEIYHKAIENFQKLYPNIKVNIKLYTDYGKIYSDVITNIATDTTPNVCITYPDHIATYMSGENNVVALNSLIADEKYGLGGSEVRFDSPTVGEIVPKFLQECAFESGYYALPYVRSTEACYINVDFVEKLGYEIPEVLTWDFIWEVSEAATEKDANGNFKLNGQKVLIPFIYKSTDNMMISMLKQRNAGYSTPQGDIMIFNSTTRQILETVGYHAGVRSFSTFKISSYPGNFLNRGQCIFAIDSTAGATWMGSSAPNIDIPENELQDFDIAVKVIPQYDVNDPKMISQGPSLCLFNKEDKQEVLASWLFMQFLLTNDVQIAYACTEGYAPVTTKAQNSKEYQSYLSDESEYEVKIQATKLLIDNIEHTFVTPVFNGSATLRNEAGELIESVANSARRKEILDEEYYDTLFEEASLRVDKASMRSKADFNEMPMISSLLICTLVVIWVLLFVYIVLNALKKRKNNR